MSKFKLVVIITITMLVLAFTLTENISFFATQTSVTKANITHDIIKFRLEEGDIHFIKAVDPTSYTLEEHDNYWKSDLIIPPFEIQPDSSSGKKRSLLEVLPHIIFELPEAKNNPVILEFKWQGTGKDPSRKNQLILISLSNEKILFREYDYGFHGFRSEQVIIPAGETKLAFIFNDHFGRGEKPEKGYATILYKDMIIKKVELIDYNSSSHHK